MTARRRGALALAFALALLAAPARAQDLVPPKILTEATAPYPAGASGNASVMIVVTIAPDGTVSDANVTSGEEPFASAAVAAAKTWTFAPATRAGKPIAAKIRVELVFRPPEIVEAPAPEQVPETPPGEKKKEAPVQDVIVRGERVEPSRTATLSRTEVR